MRGPALALLSLWLCAGCEGRKASDPPVQPVTVQPVTAQPLPLSPAAPGAASRPTFCEDQWASSRPFVAPALAEVRADGAINKTVGIRMKPGLWTWVNLFDPSSARSVEGIAQLRRWASKGAFHVGFIAITRNHDELLAFLKSPVEMEQPRTSEVFWLRGTAWLEAIHLGPSPELPVHILVDPSGRIRCVSAGAVGESEWPAIEQRLR